MQETISPLARSNIKVTFPNKSKLFHAPPLLMTDQMIKADQAKANQKISPKVGSFLSTEERAFRLLT